MLDDGALGNMIDVASSSGMVSMASPELRTEGNSPASESPESGSSECFGLGELGEEWTGAADAKLDMLELSDLLGGMNKPGAPANTEAVTPSHSPPGGAMAGTESALSANSFPCFGQPGVPVSFVGDQGNRPLPQTSAVSGIQAACLAQAQANLMAQAQLACLPTPVQPSPFMPSTLPTQEEVNAAIFAAAAAAATAAAASIPFVQAPARVPHVFMPVNQSTPVTYPVKQPDKVPIQRLSTSSEKVVHVVMETEKKTSHNKIERRYRDKLNGQLLSLRDAVPATANCPKVNKATVMRKAVEYINYLQNTNSRLRQQKEQLQALLTAHGMGKKVAELQAAEGDELSEDCAPRPKAKKGRGYKGTGTSPKSGTARTLGMALMVMCCVYNPLLPGSPVPVSGPQRLLAAYTSDGPTGTLEGVTGGLWWLLHLAVLLVLSLRLLATETAADVAPVQLETAVYHAKKSSRAQTDGDTAKGRQHVEAALAALGHPMAPRPTWRLLLAVAWQAVHQLGHRLCIGRVMERLVGSAPDGDPATAEVVGGLYQALQSVHLATDTVVARNKGAKLQLLHACLCAVNRLEDLGADCGPALLVDGYSTAVAILVVLEAPPFLLRVYSRLATNARQACIAAKMEVAPAKDWLWDDGNMAYLESGHWLPAYRLVAQAGQHYSTSPVALIGQLTRTERLLAGYWALCEGSQPVTLVAGTFTELRTQALKAGDSSTVAWCCLGSAVCTLRLNDTAGTRALLASLSRSPLASGEARSLLLVLHAAMALCPGHYNKALVAVDAASKALAQAVASLAVPDGPAQPTLRATLHCLAADTVLGVRMLLATKTKTELMQGHMARDLAVLARLAQLLPLAHTLLYRYQGCLRMRTGGHVLRTQHLLHKAVKVARHHGQLRDEGLALLLMAKLPSTCALTITRQQWLKRAHDLLVATHSYRDMQDCQLAKACLVDLVRLERRPMPRRRTVE